MSHPWQPTGSISLPITWQPRDRNQQTPNYPKYLTDHYPNYPNYPKYPTDLNPKFPNYPTDETHQTNRLNPTPVPKTLIPSSGHQTDLPLILDPFYTSGSLLSYPRTFLNPFSPKRQVPGGVQKFSTIFKSQFSPRSQLLFPLHWLLKAFATSRWGSDGIPRKLRISIIQSLSVPNAHRLSVIRFCWKYLKSN